MKSKWKRGILPEVNSWGRHWEPRTKTIASILFIIGVVSLNSPYFVLGAFSFVFLVALSMRLPFRFIVSRLAIIVPFLILMSIPLVFGGGIPPEPDRYEFAALISLKALTSMLLIVIMLTTQPLQEYLDGLAHLKLPKIFITVLFLACRYAFLFVGELKSTQRAMSSRNFSPGLNMGSLQSYGEMSGGLFIKSIDRSENVYRAMASRCFQGELPVGKPPSIRNSDYLKLVIAVLIILTVILLEWWCFN